MAWTTKVIKRIQRLRFKPSQPAVRAGVIGAASAVAGSYARGLLPRSVSDQALSTGVTVSMHYMATATAAAAAETIALYASGDHTIKNRKAPASAQLVADLGMIGAGAFIQQIFPPNPDEKLPISLLRLVGEIGFRGASSNLIVTATDELLQVMPITHRWRNRSLIVDVAVGAGMATIFVVARHRRAQRFGLVDPDRPAVLHANVKATISAIGTGVSAGVGLMVVAGTEQWLAHHLGRLVPGRIKGVEIANPWVGHLAAMGLFTAAGLGAFSTVKKRVERGGSAFEAAYDKPPTSPYVSSGPRSKMPFDGIGKEGRRFVLMALTAAEIEEVMASPAIDPIRIVAGFEAEPDTVTRAKLCLEEMAALGAFDRKVICVASPTGVGYVSYVFTEALEYLTHGDCATVMPQYALVPSALALGDTGDGAELQRLVLAGIRDRIAEMPAEKRPKLVQFGESLGAQVALDVAFPQGTWVFDELGLDGGLYLGVPFRTLTWNAWLKDPKGFDPAGELLAVSQPDVLAELEPARREQVKHLMVVHHDDPVNKFGYDQAVRPPWWMGRPDTRPPKVPREVLWRPITTFVITLIDLKNGMNFTPGTFERRGHDYRIDTTAGIIEAFRLPCTPEEYVAIEKALRVREVDWAKRRLIARKFGAARDAVNATLGRWGMNANALDSLPDFDIKLLDSAPMLREPVQYLVADQDPVPINLPEPLRINAGDEDVTGSENSPITGI